MAWWVAAGHEQGPDFLPVAVWLYAPEPPPTWTTSTKSTILAALLRGTASPCGSQTGTGLKHDCLTPAENWAETAPGPPFSAAHPGLMEA